MYPYAAKFLDLTFSVESKLDISSHLWGGLSQNGIACSRKQSQASLRAMKYVGLSVLKSSLSCSEFSPVTPAFCLNVSKGEDGVFGEVEVLQGHQKVGYVFHLLYNIGCAAVFFVGGPDLQGKAPPLKSLASYLLIQKLKACLIALIQHNLLLAGGHSVNIKAPSERVFSF